MGLTLHYDHGQTPLDEDEIHGLLISSVTTKRELDEQEQLNIQAAFEHYLFGRRSNVTQVFSEAFILEVHNKMFNRVWSWAGQFRTSEKSLGINWPQIPIQLRLLIDDCKFWMDHEIYPIQEIAIRFKHRLVAIHLFPNGNGRHSRLMADIMMKQVFKKAVFSWGQNTYYDTNKARLAYIKALKTADQGNYEPLICFAQS